MEPPIEVHNSPLRCGRSSVPLWVLRSRVFTCEQIVRQSGLIRSWRLLFVVSHPPTQAIWSEQPCWIKYTRNSLTSSATDHLPSRPPFSYQPPLFPAKEGEHIVPSVQRHLCKCLCCLPGTAQGDHGLSLNRIDGGTLFKPSLQDLVSAADIKPVTSQLQSCTTLCCFSPPVIP